VERASHGAPTFFVHGRSFLSFTRNHHGDGRVAIWCAAPVGEQAACVEGDPRRYFVPAYVGHRGWIGMRVDLDPNWDEVAAVVRSAYGTIAPASGKARESTSKAAPRPARKHRPRR
jgi:hypothetical protein